jgi:hypothetical protein
MKPRSRHRGQTRVWMFHVLCKLLSVSARSGTVQAALAVNFLGPCAAARARINRFLYARCSTYTTTPHFLSLKAQKCDLTCPSPATAPPGSSSEPGYTTRQICTIRTVNHIPNIAPQHILSISMLKHGTGALRCPPMRLCCSRVACSSRVDVLALVGRRDELP